MFFILRYDLRNTVKWPKKGKCLLLYVDANNDCVIYGYLHLLKFNNYHQRKGRSGHAFLGYRIGVDCTAASYMKCIVSNVACLHTQRVEYVQDEINGNC